ncbi:hypothetical protein BJ741DRAFT_621938 [Chytriomyces cf. hyalinus JEL632]|nr:hypothetical protein BJ741DRAFT_621938 [Chytriomyces cf. hyalinus JEL632]
MSSYTVINASVFSGCVLLIVSYHLWLASVVRRNPEKTVYGVNSLGRRAWVAAMIRGKKDILAVQSLRNLIMVSSILASTCVVIILGIIAFLATVISRPEAVDRSKNPLGGEFGFFLDQLFGAKIMGLLVVFCSAFFCFAQSMRFYNHVGMVININESAEEIEVNMHLNPQASDDELDESHDHEVEDSRSRQGPMQQQPRLSSTLHPNSSPVISSRAKRADPAARALRKRARQLAACALVANVDFVARLLNRGSMYYTFGMRGYYFSFPIMAYLWGPWSLLAATILLAFTLRVVDFNSDVMSPGYGGAGMKRRSEDLEEQGATVNEAVHLSGLGITSNSRRREGAKEDIVAV